MHVSVNTCICSLGFPLQDRLMPNLVIMCIYGMLPLSNDAHKKLV